MLVERTRQIDLQDRVLLAFRERTVPEDVRALGREEAALPPGYPSKSNRSLVYKKAPADRSCYVEQLRVLLSSNISIATPARV